MLLSDDQDVVLAELLTKCSRWIAGYHEHDSLLENRVDEKLSEDEKRVAWEEYEREKQMLINYQSAPNYSLNTNPGQRARHTGCLQYPVVYLTFTTGGKILKIVKYQLLFIMFFQYTLIKQYV